MVDPFGQSIKPKKSWFAVYLPLFIIGAFAVSAFVLSLVAIDRVHIHPNCACRNLNNSQPKTYTFV